MNTVKEGKICVEVYKDDSAPGLEEVQQERAEIQKFCNEEVKKKKQEARDLKNRYQALDLSSQVAMVNQEIQAVEIEAEARARITPEKLGYQRVSEAKMKIWEAYLPKEYKGRDLAEFSFKRIPETALVVWETAKEIGIFQEFSIRTPERKSIMVRVKERLQDPILLGWYDGAPYMIARWGESLRSFTQVKLRVWTRKSIESTIGITGFILYFCVGFWLMTEYCQKPSWNVTLHYGSWFICLPFILDFLSIFWKALDEAASSRATTVVAIAFCVGLILAIIGFVRGAESLLSGNYTHKMFLQWIIGIVIAGVFSGLQVYLGTRQASGEPQN